MKIIQISDLHLTSRFYEPEWGKNLLEQVNSMSPDVLIVTGDFTHDGLLYEYETAREYLEGMDVKNKVIVPGNHDAKNAGYQIFEELFGSRFPEYSDSGIIILGIDSSEPDIDDGHVGRENCAYIKKRLSGDSRIKILALHHHLIPIPGTGRERQIPVDAGDVLGLCTDLKIDYVLSGHKHKPRIWQLDGTYFITAGAATTKRLKGRSYPSFNILELLPGAAKLTEVNVSDGSERTIMDTLNDKSD